MKKLIACTLAAAVVAQIWGMFSWMALSWHMTDFKQFSNDENVTTVLRAELQGSGLYTLPNMDMTVYEDEAALAAWNNRARQGPFAFISVRADGIDTGKTKPMIIGFLLNLATALILFWLLANCSINSTGGRTLFIAIAGSVGALSPHLSSWNWWHFPITYCVIGVIDLLIAWALAGFVMVKLSDRLGSEKAA